MIMSENNGEFDSWAIVELMGHVKHAGRLTEEERFGAKMGRIDIPYEDTFRTVYFTAASVYRLTVVTEEIARAVARTNQPRPVYAYQLEAPKASANPREPDYEDEGLDFDNEDTE
jgi:hypothetical protein